jgi:hypothetical protein
MIGNTHGGLVPFVQHYPYLEFDGVQPSLRDSTVAAPHVSANANPRAFIGSYYEDQQQDPYFACDSSLKYALLALAASSRAL